MIKANELRIGNYLEDSFGNQYQIDEDDIKRMCCTEMMKPIQLTEEWLLKFGFTQQRDGSFQKNDFSIFLDKRFRTNLYLQDNERNSFKWFSYECNIKHVHQLQNLYFALTGEELEYK